MAWYDEAVFYHIYPLGMTGAPQQNDYGEPVERLNLLLPWLGHIKAIGCNALYIGPLFESVGHGYETVSPENFGIAPLVAAVQVFVQASFGLSPLSAV